jgi:hypothetical protein
MFSGRAIYVIGLLQLGYDKGNVSTSLQGLERKGLIRVQRTPGGYVLRLAIEQPFRPTMIDSDAYVRLTLIAPEPTLLILDLQ